MPEPMEAAFSLGSNLGDRNDHLRRACEALAAMPGFRITDVSPLYETDPVGVRPEHADRSFLNAVLIGTSDDTPLTLSTRIHAIETRLGRVRNATDRYAPRMIDIDILYFGNVVIQSPELQLPHPHCLSRRFVCVPLADLRPSLVLPGQSRTVVQARNALPATPSVRRIADTWTGALTANDKHAKLAP